MQRTQTKKITSLPKTLNKAKGTKKPTLELKLNEDMVHFKFIGELIKILIS